MFSIAVETGKLCRRPVFKMLDGEKIRQGFVEHGDFLRVLTFLPEHFSQFIEFLYYGGWRKSAARKLEWKEIDLQGRTARLKAEDSKNGEAWVLPLSGSLWEIIQVRARRAGSIRRVFSTRTESRSGTLERRGKARAQKPESLRFSFTTCAVVLREIFLAPESASK